VDHVRFDRRRIAFVSNARRLETPKQQRGSSNDSKQLQDGCVPHHSSLKKKEVD
jgi:hypothetical protein